VALPATSGGSASQSHDAVQIDCGMNSSGYLTRDGRIFTWGQGPLGHSVSSRRTDAGSQTSSKPKLVSVGGRKALLEPCTAFSLGELHGGAVTESGKLWMWGKNSSGCLGTGRTTKSLKHSTGIFAAPSTIDQGAAGPSKKGHPGQSGELDGVKDPSGSAADGTLSTVAAGGGGSSARAMDATDDSGLRAPSMKRDRSHSEGTIPSELKGLGSGNPAVSDRQDDDSDDGGAASSSGVDPSMSLKDSSADATRSHSRGLTRPSSAD